MQLLPQTSGWFDAVAVDNHRNNGGDTATTEATPQRRGIAIARTKKAYYGKFEPNVAAMIINNSYHGCAHRIRRRRRHEDGDDDDDDDDDDADDDADGDNF